MFNSDYTAQTTAMPSSMYCVVVAWSFNNSDRELQGRELEGLRPPPQMRDR